MSDNLSSPSQQISGCSYALRLDIGQGEVTASDKVGYFERIDPVILGFAAVDGFHVQGMAKDEIDTYLLAEVSDPVPAVHTFDPNYNVTDIRCEKLAQLFWIG